MRVLIIADVIEMPKRLAGADGPSIMNSVLIDVSDDGTATSRERVDREVDLDGS